MGLFDDDVVADLQCRFSEGETPTWEEFYDWIDAIQEGFETHAHAGAGAGDGAYIAMTSLVGIEEYENIRDLAGSSAIVTAVLAAQAAITALQSDAVALELRVTTLEGSIGDMATQTWVDANYYSQAILDYCFGLLETDIADHESRITAIEGAGYTTKAYVDGQDATVLTTALNAVGVVSDRVTAIEADYVVAADLALYALKTYVDGQDATVLTTALNACDVLAGRISDIEADYLVEADLDPYATVAFAQALQQDVYNTLVPILNSQGARITAIEADYATETWVAANYYTQTQVLAITDPIEYDVSDLDDRVGDIEADYTTEIEAYIQGEEAFIDCIRDAMWEHENDCSCYNQC